MVRNTIAYWRQVPSLGGKGLLDESTKHWGPVLSQIKATDVPSFSHQFSCAIASYPMLSLNISRRLA